MPRPAGWLALWLALLAACSGGDAAAPAAPPAAAPAEPEAAAPGTPSGPSGASAGVASAASADAPEPVELPPRRPVAGLRGFQSTSRITFFEQPDRPHVLTATYQFPERVRLRLAREEGEIVDRVLCYRAGARGFAIDERTSASRELAGPELGRLQLGTELRRAAFLWPDGFAWSGAGEEREALLPGLGRITARLGDDGRPASLAALDLAGGMVESLEELAWSPTGERAFPASFVLAERGARVWREQVTGVDTVVHFVDDFFLPPDRRGELGADAARATR